MNGPKIIEIDGVDAVLEPFDWEVPARFKDKIDDYWQQNAVNNPGIFDGTVLLQHRGEVKNRRFSAGYFATNYRNMLGYLRLGLQPQAVRNGFAMAALRSADGAFLLGEMGPNTANAGKIYFAAGTPDLGDVTGSNVDIEGSALRELFEETGLRAGDVRPGKHGWSAVIMEPRVAFMCDMRIDLPALEAKALMLERMKDLHEDELSGIVIIRAGDRLDEARMPEFMVAYLKREFERG